MKYDLQKTFTNHYYDILVVAVVVFFFSYFCEDPKNWLEDSNEANHSLRCGVFVLDRIIELKKKACSVHQEQNLQSPKICGVNGMFCVF